MSFKSDLKGDIVYKTGVGPGYESAAILTGGKHYSTGEQTSSQDRRIILTHYMPPPHTNALLRGQLSQTHLNHQVPSYASTGSAPSRACGVGHQYTL